MLLENDSDRRLIQICHKPSIWLKNKTKKVQYLWSVTEWGRLMPELLSPCFWSLHFQKKSLVNSRVVQHLRVFTAEGTDSTKFPQFSSVAQTLCDPTDCSTPGFPVHHQLPEFTQTHVYWVGDAIQPSHPQLSPSPPAFNLSQHQGFF